MILVTGSSGFIGFHTAIRLLERGERIIGLDNMNDYYDVSLKEDRLSKLQCYEHFTFCRGSIEDKQLLKSLFESHEIDGVIHLAAQAGVRYSIDNPYVYIQSNAVGFLNVLEQSRIHQIRHFVYASSSSVYGSNETLPFSEKDQTDHPLNLYAATKKANELIAHAYSSLYKLPTTGIRIFTAYGPWGRPDMALFKFTERILKEEPVDLYNEGKMTRDFTYIDDVTEAIVRLTDRPAAASSNKKNSNGVPYQVVNIGNRTPVTLMDFISAIEQKLDRKAVKNFLPMQPGDVPVTVAEVDKLYELTGFRPDYPVEKGISRFIDWYREYYKI